MEKLAKQITVQCSACGNARTVAAEGWSAIVCGKCPSDIWHPDDRVSEAVEIERARSKAESLGWTFAGFAFGVVLAHRLQSYSHAPTYRKQWVVWRWDHRNGCLSGGDYCTAKAGAAASMQHRIADCYRDWQGGSK